MFFIPALLIALLGFSCQELSGATPIIFTSHKNAQMSSLSKEFLQQLIDIFKVSIFVETGTYQGGTTAQAASLFKTIHTVELYEPLAKAAIKKFADQKHVTVHQGNSPDIFKKILPTLKNQGTILFFLDAHYSGDGTALGEEGAQEENGITAIRKELTAIKQCEVENCIILIDDIRGFGTKIAGKKYPGCWAYPPIQDLRDRLLDINNNFSFLLIGDIFLAFDKTAYIVPCSPIVQACTINRLFDGSNYTEDTLLKSEQIIASAQTEEKEFIIKLHSMMTQYHDPEFHHDLWYALLCLNDQKYAEATKEFIKVIERGYNHPRIQQYLALTKAQ